MGLEAFDDYECEGQMSLEDLFSVEIPENIFAVSKIFASARKQMNIAELKTFTYALSQFKFKEENKNTIMLDKKTLAAIVGISSDTDHLSQDLKRSIGKLPRHSFIEFEDKDSDFYESGVLVTQLRMYRDKVWLKFDEDYMPLFSKLESDYITMWSGDIFRMSSERSIEFYEQLRLNTFTDLEVNTARVGVKWFKELFNIPKEGKGSYMRKKGGFNRSEFEKKVIDTLCEDLAKCKMINLIMQPDGKYYRKVKTNGRVKYYEFEWTYSAYPRVATASEVKQISERVDQNPQVLKVAKDIVNGKKKQEQQAPKVKPHEYNFDELERKLLSKNLKE